MVTTTLLKVTIKLTTICGGKSRYDVGHYRKTETKNPASKQGLKVLLGFPRKCKWWRRRESNPRPQILRFQLYMLISSIILTTSYPMNRENK